VIDENVSGDGLPVEQIKREAGSGLRVGYESGEKCVIFSSILQESLLLRGAWRRGQAHQAVALGFGGLAWQG
jgi:hypothetical protein